MRTNERVGAHGVIADRKRRDLDLGTQFGECVGDSRRSSTSAMIFTGDAFDRAIAVISSHGLAAAL